MREAVRHAARLTRAPRGWRRSGGLTPVPVVITFGQSNSTGARNDATEITGHPGLASSARAKIWDAPTGTIRTLVPGIMEAQPGIGFIDPAFTNTVGWKGEFDRFWLRDNPSGTIYHFGFSIGGSRFTNASPTFGAVANWGPGVSGGCREAMLTQWTAFKAALAAEGKVPSVSYMVTDLGYSSATDNTEAAAYQADMTALIAWVRANIGSATSRLTIARLPASIGGIPSNLATLRAAQAAIAAADAYTDLIYMDDAQYAPGAADGVHLSAAQHMLQGERFYCRFANRDHPMDDLVNGSAIFPTDLYRPGDWRNTVVSGAVDTVFDGIRGIVAPRPFSQGVAGARPVLVTETTGDGLSLRVAAFDGVDDKLVCTTGLTNGRSAWGLIAAMRVTTPGSGAGAPIGQGAAGNIFPFTALRVNAAGRAEWFARNNADVVTGPTELATAAAGGNVLRHFAQASDAAGVTGTVDGVTGAKVPYAGGAFGTADLDRTSLGVLFYGGGDLFFAACGIAEFWFTNTTPDAAYLAKARAWNQWRWGTAA